MEKIDTNDLVIPIYLNEKVVLDMLAIIEDGFSTVSMVSTSASNGNVSDGKLGFNASVNGLLSRLLKISLGSSYARKSEGKITESVDVERTHTIASLFSKFRRYLVDQNLIVEMTDKLSIDKIRPGMFVEAKGKLEKNPLIYLLEELLGVIKFSDIVTEEPQLGNKKKNGEKQAVSSNKIKQIEAFLNMLKTSGAEDLVMNNDISIVLPVQEDYLYEGSSAELIGGHFKVLGKIVRVYENENVSLVRNTPLSMLSNNDMQDFLSAFHTRELQQYNIPEMRTEVQAPAVLMLPIAIYV